MNLPADLQALAQHVEQTFSNAEHDVLHFLTTQNYIQLIHTEFYRLEELFAREKATVEAEVPNIQQEVEAVVARVTAFLSQILAHTRTTPGA